MSEPLKLAGPELRRLKSAAQLIKPTLKIGKAGLTTELLGALDAALNEHELVKVKFEAFKEQKRELVPQLVSRSASVLILRVGNVAVLHRPKAPSAEARVIAED
ncbi:MAG: YhbY family RNA-binding protein [Verrucomicrobia bacterium]|nr:YhbY family RNA-binding protein [Verrucomicrobiota bacterium]